MGLSFQIFGTGGLAMKMCLAILCKHQNYDELNGCKGGKKRKKKTFAYMGPQHQQDQPKIIGMFTKKIMFLHAIHDDII